MNSNKLSVIKIGGSTIDDWYKSVSQINEIINMGNSLVIVHGGGKTVSDWGAKPVSYTHLTLPTILRV